MLTLCSKCRQFHRRDEDRCPFCGSRSAFLKAAVLGAAVALTGCRNEPEPSPLYGVPPTVQKPVPPPEPYNVPVAEYGVPPMARVKPQPIAEAPDAGAEPPAVKPEPRPVPVPAYGVVPVPPRPPENPKKRRG